MIKRFLTPLMAAIFLVSIFGVLAGCNTVEGAGKDIERGGSAIQNEAREHK